MLAFLLTFNALFMLVLPLLLAHFFAKYSQRRLDWGLFGVGAITFILSQVGHIPFNWLILQKWQWIPLDNLLLLALFGGLSAGIFEEVARYLTYRYWATQARDWGNGIMLGLGHGGVESIFWGLIAGINGYVLIAFQQGRMSAFIPLAQQPLMQAQLEAVANLPFYMLLLGALERVFAITLHICLSLMVMYVFTRRQYGWLLLAIAWHAFVNTMSVWVVSTWGALWAEAAIGLCAVFCLFFIWYTRDSMPAIIKNENNPIEPPSFSSKPLRQRPLELSSEQLDESRFQ